MITANWAKTILRDKTMQHSSNNKSPSNRKLRQQATVQGPLVIIIIFAWYVSLKSPSWLKIGNPEQTNGESLEKEFDKEEYLARYI